MSVGNYWSMKNSYRWDLSWLLNFYFIHFSLDNFNLLSFNLFQLLYSYFSSTMTIQLLFVFLIIIIIKLLNNWQLQHFIPSRQLISFCSRFHCIQLSYPYTYYLLTHSFLFYHSNFPMEKSNFLMSIFIYIYRYIWSKLNYIIYHWCSLLQTYINVFINWKQTKIQVCK